MGRSLKWRIAAHVLAARRRIMLALGRDYFPYDRPFGLALDPSDMHRAVLDEAPLKLSWANAGVDDPRQWQADGRVKLAALLGCRDAPAPARLVEELRTGIEPGLERRTVYLRAEPGHDIPVHVLEPVGKAATLSRPVLLYLAGSTSGVHIGWGEVRMPADPLRLAVGADMARQAARAGYLVVCIEQIGFGERAERKLGLPYPARCVDAANHALLIGRTLLGERVADVLAVVDWICAGGAGPNADTETILIFGHSSGGTAAIYAAALDARIGVTVASGSVGPIGQTIAVRRAPEGEAVVPGILQWFEMADLVAMCAPRPFIAVSGEADHLYPFAGAQAVVEAARPVYAAMGAAAEVAAVSGPGAHRYYPTETWAALSNLVPQLPTVGAVD